VKTSTVDARARAGQHRLSTYGGAVGVLAEPSKSPLRIILTGIANWHVWGSRDSFSRDEKAVIPGVQAFGRVCEMH